MPPHKRHVNHDMPHLITFPIQLSANMLDKLQWEITQFEYAMDARPCDPSVMAYIAHNICVTSWSISEWVFLDLERTELIDMAPWKNKIEYQKYVIDWCWELNIARDVANTVKHAGYDDRGWKNGVCTWLPIVPTDLLEKYNIASDMEKFNIRNTNRDQIGWRLQFRIPERDIVFNADEVFAKIYVFWRGHLRDMALG